MIITPVHTGAEPASKSKGVSFDFKPRKTKETVIDKENEERNTMKPGVTNNEKEKIKSEEIKGVKEVDEKV